MNKQVLRDLFLEKRKTLTKEEFERRNHLVFTNTIEFLIEHRHKRHIHLFMTMAKNHEVDTTPILEWLLNSKKHQVVVPKVEKDRNLSHHILESGENLSLNKWGIPEPQNTKTVHPNLVDLVFVPLISFDRKGNRIGYGGGFYDNFLKDTRRDCLKIGLSISPPLDHIDYTETHDIPLDMCITHHKKYLFNF